MLRRRSMAMTAAGVPTDGRGNRLSSVGDIIPITDDEKKRWSSVSSDVGKDGSYLTGLGLGSQSTDAQRQNRVYHAQGHQLNQRLPVQYDKEAEEHLDDRLELARRNSIDHAAIKRASYVSSSVSVCLRRGLVMGYHRILLTGRVIGHQNDAYSAAAQGVNPV